MKKLVIDDSKTSMITNVAVRARHDDSSRNYDIYTVGGSFNNDLVLGINWSACGTVSPEETMKFAMHLTQASGMVSAINALGATKKYSDEPLYNSKDEYLSELKKVYDMVSGYRTAELIAWLLDGAEVE